MLTFSKLGRFDALEVFFICIRCRLLSKILRRMSLTQIPLKPFRNGQQGQLTERNAEDDI